MASVIEPIKGIEGQVIGADDEEYDAARRIYNGMIDRRPELIVRVAGADDVARVLDHARSRELPISVRGGGHNVAGNALVQGGVVIDCSQRRDVTVDPAGRSAVAEPGATWYDFDQVTQGHGLATTGGLISTTGVAGFTLGGGIGWLVRRHGLAADNLIEAEVVMADGRRAVASAEEDSDLLWALRGGGGNFGVVTRLKFEVHPLGPVTGGLVAHPRPRAGDLLRFWRDFVETAPDELTTMVALLTTPDGHPAAGLACCHAGEPSRAAAEVAPLKEFGPPLADHIDVLPYTVLQSSLDATAPAGLRNYWKSDFANGLTDGFIDTLIEIADRAPSPLCQVHLHHLGGRLREEPAGGSAFPNRGADFVYNLIGCWEDPGEDDVNIDWARTAFEELRAFSLGSAYVNFLGDDGEARVRAAYGANYDRLAALKRRYDPDNVFRLNQNVRPA
jgi:FAD/FMN-containing dehydrogenase